MQPPSPERPLSFADVALSRPFKQAFIVLALLAVLGIAAGAVMLPAQPPGASGTTTQQDIAIDVPDSAEPPMKVSISHTYRLVTRPALRSFYVEDGVDEIAYNITVYDGKGQRVAGVVTSIAAPDSHIFASEDSDESVTVSKDHRFTLHPGRYNVSLIATHEVSFTIEQTSKLVTAGAALLGMGVVCLILIAVMVLLAFWKRDSLERSRMPPAPAAAPYGSAPGPPAAPMPAWEPSRPAPGPQHSSLEFVPGGMYAEIQCSYCGSSIRNPPVNGVIVCDRCGQMGRLY